MSIMPSQYHVDSPLLIVRSHHHHFNTQQLIKEKTTNLVADQKCKKWLCPEMHDSESTHHELLMVHSSIYCQIKLIDSKEQLVH